MKTLEAFWRWVDNEKPRTLTIIQKTCGSKALTPLARAAIDCAADVVCEMHKGAPPGFSLRYAFDWHRDDLRDVSFALLLALEKVIVRRDANQIQCAGCGLEHGFAYPHVPSVQRRTDGVVRCNDCDQHAHEKAKP